MISVRKARLVGEKYIRHDAPGEFPSRFTVVHDSRNNNGTGVNLTIRGPRIASMSNRAILCTLFVDNNEQISMIKDRRPHIPAISWKEMMAIKRKVVTKEERLVQLEANLKEMVHTIGYVHLYNVATLYRERRIPIHATVTITGKHFEDRVVELTIAETVDERKRLNRRLTSEQQMSALVVHVKPEATEGQFQKAVRERISKLRQSWGC